MLFLRIQSSVTSIKQPHINMMITASILIPPVWGGWWVLFSIWSFCQNCAVMPLLVYSGVSWDREPQWTDKWDWSIPVFPKWRCILEILESRENKTNKFQQQDVTPCESWTQGLWFEFPVCYCYALFMLLLCSIDSKKISKSCNMEFHCLLKSRFTHCIHFLNTPAEIVKNEYEMAIQFGLLLFKAKA